MAVVTNQTHFRVRTDATAAQGGTPVWAAALDTNPAQGFVGVGTPFRIRFAISNTGSTTTGVNPWNLFVSRNGGAFAQVTTSTTFVQTVDATAGASTENSAITSSLLGGTGTFTGIGVYDDTGTTGNVNIPATDFSEFEFGIKFTNSVVAGDTYAFEMFLNSVALNSYSQTPTITIPIGPSNIRQENPQELACLAGQPDPAAYYSFIGGQAPLTPVMHAVTDNPIVTIFQGPLTSGEDFVVNSGNTTGLDVRTIMASGVLANVTNCNYIRVTVSFGASTSSGRITRAWIGAQGTGNAYNFDGTQRQLSFNGLPSISGIGASALVTSDWCYFPQFDHTKNLTISLFIESTTGTSNVTLNYLSSTSSTEYWFAPPPDESADTTPAGSWFQNSGRLDGIARIEMMAAAPPVSWNLPSHLPPALSSILAWQPDPVYYQFDGGQEPYQPRYLPAQITAVPVNNPPFSGRDNATGVLVGWIPPPPQPIVSGLVNPSAEAVPVSNPPFTHPGRSAQTEQQAIAGWAWQPDPVYYQYFGGFGPYIPGRLPPAVTAVPVNNPTPAVQGQMPWWTWWLPPDPAQQLQPKLAQGPPVTFTPKTPDLSAVFAGWIPAAPSPIVAQNLNPAFEAVPANNPPFSSRDNASGILAAWIPPPPQPIVAGNLNPAVEAVPVNNPPFGIPSPSAPAIATWWIPPPPQAPVAGQLNPAVETVSVSNPPFSQPNPILADILTAWIPPPAQAPVAGALNAAFETVRVDNPPFSQRNHLVGILAAWIPPPPQPIVAGQLNPAVETVEVDNPPFGISQPSLLSIQTAWIPPPPQPIVAGQLNPVFEPLPVSNPPFGISQPSLLSIQTAWIPPPPQPIVAGTVNAAFEAVSVNNPPFGVPSPYVGVIRAAWEPPPPQPIVAASTGALDLFFITINNPPFSHPGRNEELSRSIAAWQPDPALYTFIGGYSPFQPVMAAVTANPIVTIFQGPLNSGEDSVVNPGNVAGLNVRDLMASSVLANVTNCNFIRVWFQFGASTSGGQITDAWIGEHGAGNAYNFDGNQAQLFFGGLPSIAGLGANALVISDWCYFPQFDHTKTLIISLLVQSTSGTTTVTLEYLSSTASTEYWFAPPPDQASITAPTGSWFQNSGRTDGIARIEMMSAAPPVPVNSPSHLAPTQAAIAAWQPDPVYYEHFGGQAPYLPRYLPDQITAVEVDNPPFNSRDNLSGLLAAWIPPPPQPIVAGLVNPSGEAISVSNPPFIHPGRSAQIEQQSLAASAWQPDPVYYEHLGGRGPYLPRYLPAAISNLPANNPPVNLVSASVLSSIQDAWIPPLPQPIVAGQLTPAVESVLVSNPPFAGLAPNRDAVLAAWIPPPPQPIVPGPTRPAIESARIDNPTFIDLRASRDAVLAAWIPPPPAPIVATPLNPAISAVSVNNPPFNQRNNLVGILDAAWEPLQPQPTTGPNFTQRSVDNPPFGQKPVLTGLAAWDLPPQPIVGVKLTPPSVDNPPFGARPALTGLAIWDVPVQPVLPSRTVFPGAPPQVPKTIDQVSIVEAWIAPPGLPVLPGLLYPGLMLGQQPPPLVRVDVSGAWVAPQIVPVVAENLAPPLLVLNQPPPPLRLLDLSGSWVTVPPAPQLLVQLPQGVTVFTPRSSPIDAILAAWLPAAPSPVLGQLLNPILEAVRVDIPPVRLRQIISEIAWWTTYHPQQLTGAHVAALMQSILVVDPNYYLVGNPIVRTLGEPASEVVRLLIGTANRTGKN